MIEPHITNLTRMLLTLFRRLSSFHAQKTLGNDDSIYTHFETKMLLVVTPHGFILRTNKLEPSCIKILTAPNETTVQ